MNDSLQDKAVQETPQQEQFPHPYFFNDMSFYKLNDDDFIGACQMGRLYAIEHLAFIKRNPTKSCILTAIASIGRPDLYSAAKPDKTLGFQVGFFTTVEKVLDIAVRGGCELDKDFGESESGLAYYGGWLKQFDSTHNAMERLKAEEKQRTSDRCRKAAMIRWHGKDSQAVKSL